MRARHARDHQALRLLHPEGRTGGGAGECVRRRASLGHVSDEQAAKGVERLWESRGALPREGACGLRNMRCAIVCWVQGEEEPSPSPKAKKKKSRPLGVANGGVAKPKAPVDPEKAKAANKAKAEMAAKALRKAQQYSAAQNASVQARPLPSHGWIWHCSCVKNSANVKHSALIALP